MTHLLNPEGKRLTPEALFEDWLSVRAKASHEPLSRKAALPYSYIWKKWCAWLAQVHDSADLYLYLSARTADVSKFLREGPSPSSKRKSVTRPISPITRQRYGRVLREIYLHAVNFGFAEHNPVAEASLGAPPNSTERSGQVLPPKVFESLAQVMHAQPTPYQKRDNAILWLLLDCAMTSAELREITVKDVTKNKDAPGQFLLTLDGPRGVQERTVSTHGPTGAALHAWLVHRKVMNRNTEVVFISEKRGAMTHVALFRLVANTVARACAHAGMDMPNHVGPGSIRNTAIVRWYNQGVPIERICEQCGIKDARTLLNRLKLHLVATQPNPLPSPAPATAQRDLPADGL